MKGSPKYPVPNQSVRKRTAAYIFTFELVSKAVR